MSTLIENMKLTVDAAEARRNQLALVLGWGLIGGVALVVAPVIFILMAATTALVLTACIAAASIAFAPVVAMKLANWRLAALLAEAKKHPIETLENELVQRKAALRAARKHLQTGLAQVEAFVREADKAASDYPDSADRWRERSNQARQLANVRGHRYLQATQAVDAFEREVQRSRTEWKLAVAEAAMNESINASSGDPLSALASRTAIEAVTLRMNEAFAGLQIALLEGQASNRELVTPGRQS